MSKAIDSQQKDQVRAAAATKGWEALQEMSTCLADLA